MLFKVLLDLTGRGPVVCYRTSPVVTLFPAIEPNLSRPSATERRRALLNQTASTTSLLEERRVNCLELVDSETGAVDLLLERSRGLGFFALGSFMDLLFAISGCGGTS